MNRVQKKYIKLLFPKQTFESRYIFIFLVMFDKVANLSSYKIFKSGSDKWPRAHVLWFFLAPCKNCKINCHSKFPTNEIKVFKSDEIRFPCQYLKGYILPKYVTIFTFCIFIFCEFLPELQCWKRTKTLYSQNSRVFNSHGLPFLG